MGKYTKLIVSILTAIVLFLGAVVLYQNLSKIYSPESFGESTEDSGGYDSTDKEKEEDKTVAAPDFTVTDQNGNSVKLSDFFGKPIVLNFWASWCPPCKSEMPHFEKAYKNNPDIQFLMVNVTASDTMAEAKNYISGEGYTFPVFYDTKGTAAWSYSASSLPTTFFINAEGKVVTYAIGMLSEANLEKRIELIKK